MLELRKPAPDYTYLLILLTRPSAYSIIHVCDRMPVMLPKDTVRGWIDPEEKQATEIIGQAITDVVVEKVRKTEIERLLPLYQTGLP